MKTILQKIKDIRDQFADMFHADPLRKNGTATKEYLDYLEGLWQGMTVRVKVVEIITMAQER
jgi:hypothetical protein